MLIAFLAKFHHVNHLFVVAGGPGIAVLVRIAPWLISPPQNILHRLELVSDHLVAI